MMKEVSWSKRLQDTLPDDLQINRTAYVNLHLHPHTVLQHIENPKLGDVKALVNWPDNVKTHKLQHIVLADVQQSQWNRVAERVKFWTRNHKVIVYADPNIVTCDIPGAEFRQMPMMITTALDHSASGDAPEAPLLGHAVIDAAKLASTDINTHLYISDITNLANGMDNALIRHHSTDFTCEVYPSKEGDTGDPLVWNAGQLELTAPELIPDNGPVTAQTIAYRSTGTYIISAAVARTSSPQLLLYRRKVGNSLRLAVKSWYWSLSAVANYVCSPRNTAYEPLPTA